MASSSFGQSTSQSTSTPVVIRTPENDLMMQIAQQAMQMAPQVYQWGMDQYTKNQGDIDGVMRDALSYASPQRIAVDMGMAEAGVQQAGEQGRQAALQDLQSYGIDPSSGRYAALDEANRVQTAASAAGAGNQQRMADIAAGNAMRQQAVSAGLQNTQIGYNAANAYNALLGTAMQVKNPPVGQVSQSTSQSTQGSVSGGGGGDKSPTENEPGGGGGGSGGGGGLAPPVSSQGKGGGGDAGHAGGGGGGRGSSSPGSGNDPPQGPQDSPKPLPDDVIEDGDPPGTPPIDSTDPRTWGTGEPSWDPPPQTTLPWPDDGGGGSGGGGDDGGGGGGDDGGGDGGGTADGGDGTQNIGAYVRPDDSNTGYFGNIAIPGVSSIDQTQATGDTSTTTGGGIDAGTNQSFDFGSTGGFDTSQIDWGQPATPDVSDTGTNQSYDFGNTADFDTNAADNSLDWSVPDYSQNQDDSSSQGEDSGQDPYAGDAYDSSGGDYGGGDSSYDYSGGGDSGDYGGDSGDESYARGGPVKPTGYRPTRPPPRPQAPGAGGPMQQPPQPPMFADPRRPAGNGPMMMAKGGRVQPPTTGGFVSRSLSPSNGSQTDDIPARLNAGEFVIPRDVAAWKGKEFFHKLIAQARKTRDGGPAPQKTGYRQ